MYCFIFYFYKKNMELFEYDALATKSSKYETNHYHMVIDGNMDFPVEKMNNEDYSTFFHEYIHYLQHITTLFGVKICTMYNNMFKLYIDYLRDNKTIHLPLRLWENDDNLNKFIHHFTSIRGDKKCNCNINEVEVYIEDINCARKNKTAVNIGVYDFDNDKAYECGFKFGYTCIIESMSYLLQSLIGEKYLADIPYHAVELICKNYYPEVSEDKKKMISLCLCSLMFDNPGVGFFDVIDLSRNNKNLNGLELYEMFVKKCSTRYKDKVIPIYEALNCFLNELKLSTEYSIGVKLDYYSMVFENCKKEISSGTSMLLYILYNKDIADRKMFTELIVELYGYPFIDAKNITVFPKNEIDQPYYETVLLLGLELLIKRVDAMKDDTECRWLRICRTGMYIPDADCKVSMECNNNQWDKKEKCLMTEIMGFYDIRNKKFIQEY